MTTAPKTTLDVTFARQQFPFFQLENPSIQGFFDNAAGTFTTKDVIERLNYFYLNNKVQPYSNNPIGKAAGEQMDAGRKAIAYSLNQWPKLVRYLDDGRLNIDNNRAERAIKPFVIGRKNWLFSNTVKGANASAILYSVIETAKANGLIPFDYLTKIFNELPKLDDEAELDHLLPWNIALK